MKYFSGFSGIGGFEVGIIKAYESYAYEQVGQSIGKRYDSRASLERQPQLPACVGFSEIDRYAKAIYRHRFPEHRNFGDAAKIIPDELPEFDFFCAGFPCQSFSVAGKRRGFDDARGTMFFEIARILSHKRPAHFLLENVKGLASHDEGETQNEIFRILSELGYFVERPLLNSKDFGVPQNRERVFFIGHLAERCSREILLIGNGDETAIQAEYERNLSGTISTKNQSGQCNFDGSTTLIFGKDGKQKNKTVASTLTGGGHSGGNHSDMDLIAQPTIYDFNGARNNKKMSVREHTDGIVRALKSSQSGTSTPMVGTLRTHKDGEGFREMQSGLAPTLNARARQDGSSQPVIEVDSLIRRLTPIECERLQGFPDDWTKYGLFENGEILEISDTQRYKTCGNAVTTNVIEAVILRMIEVGCLFI